MKKQLIIIAIVVAGLFQARLACAQQASAQQMLLDSIYGKWVVKEVYKDNKFVNAANSGTIDFQQDGMFTSVGNYFGNKKGSYRTDENRIVIYMDETKRKTTEWKTSVKNDTLELRSVDKSVKNKKTPKIYMVLVREENKVGSR